MKNIIYPIMTVLCLLFLVNPDANAQPKYLRITGTVIEKESDMPLPGANVSVQRKNSSEKLIHTMTDLDGNFNLIVPTNSTLTVTCVGFDPVNLKMKANKTKLTIYMEEQVNLLDEAVVVGYQNKSVADNTASVTVVDMKDVAKAPVANVMELLQGRVPGLNIQMNNGSPGASGTFMIRGISDISVQSVENSDGSTDYMLSSSAPLFVVDGIPQEDVDSYDAQGLLSGSGVSPLSMIPYEDIEDIQVLKDASATALYGSKGAYGVVVITTKKGNSKKPVVNYSMDYKLNLPPRLRDVLGGRSERLLRIEQILENDTSAWHGYDLIHNTQILSDSLNPYFNNSTNWQDNFYRKTSNQTHNLSVSGGDKKFNYKINGNVYMEDGILKNTDFNRYGIRMNMGYSPNKKFDMSVYVNATLGITGSGSGNSFSQKGAASGASASSLLPPPSLYTASNAALGALMVESNATNIVYDAGLNLRYTLPFNISWNGTFGYKYSTNEEETYTPGILNGNKTKIYGKSSNSYRLYGRTGLSYSTKLLKILKVGLSVGMEISSNRSKGNAITLEGAASDHLWGPIGYSKAGGTASSKTEDNTVAFTFNPSFQVLSLDPTKESKYSISPSIRPELNSAYGNKPKWTINPGLGFKWNYSEENFCDNLDWLSYGALRVTWGRTTKYKADRYDVWGTYLLNEYTYNGQPVIPIDFGLMPNQNLSPVVSTQWNLGTDLHLFQHRYVFVADAYYKQTDNQIWDNELADHNAFDKVKSTDVSLVNYGLELSLNMKPLPVQCPFDLSLLFSFSINKDVIAKLPDEARQILNAGSTIVNKLGSNALSNYLYVYKGVYATDEDVPVDPATGRRLRVGGDNVSADNPDAYFRAGDPIWVDINGDYVIDEKDKVIAGNSQPRYQGGISINMRWKNFSLFTSTSFILKRDIINKVLADNFKSYAKPYLKDPSANAAIVPIDSYNFWTPDNIHADYPNPYDFRRSELIDPFRPDQTLFMEDGSYFKINNITLSYTFPKRLTDFFGISSASIRANINNLYTFSKYSGINPENVNGLGWDTSGGYPSARSFSMGINIRF